MIYVEPCVCMFVFFHRFDSNQCKYETQFDSKNRRQCVSIRSDIENDEKRQLASDEIAGVLSFLNNNNTFECCSVHYQRINASFCTDQFQNPKVEW